jgi:hypothetical protein
MVFGPDDQRVAELTLCFFPHLPEFVVVDARAGLPLRPRVTVLRAEDVLDADFYKQVEADFSQLLRRTEQPFLKLMGLPQEVEGLVRMHGLRAILERLGDPAGSKAADLTSTVAVFFCAGPFLALEGDRMREAVKNMFGTQLSGEALAACANAIVRLADQERLALGQAPSADLSDLIRGDNDRYATLWQNNEKS